MEREILPGTSTPSRLNQDGNMAWQPFWLDENGRSMNRLYMTLDHLDPDPPEEVFIKMGATREE